MSPPADAAPLQFDTLEPASPLSCATCHCALPAEHRRVDGRPSCEPCTDAAIAEAQRRPDKKALLRACLYGGGAAAAGSLLWFAVSKITGLEIGLIAVAIGAFVGRAVKRGAGGRSSRATRVMAIALTYVSIVTSYMPDVAKGLFEAADNGREKEKAAEVARTHDDGTSSAGAPVNPIVALAAFAAICFGIAFVAPFLAGASNIIGILIIGFALLEAWRANRSAPPPITGPVASGAPPAI